MIRTLFACAAALSVVLAASSHAIAAPAPAVLKVSENKRFLVTGEGKPFFYLGDTAWELFHRLNREDAELYLKDRAGKGYTVIQAVALAEFGGLTEPNPYGHLPLKDNDPAQPQEPYFQHVDWVIAKANELGMTVALLPTWGDKVNKKWGQGPEIFTPANAAAFGEFLGKRYEDRSIIWMLGGDRPVEKPEHLEVWRAMAAGIKKGDGGKHLVTYHPMGGQSSSAKVHDEPWLDFNTFQSGHGRKDAANWEMLRKDYERQPTKPTLDSEPCYENHPVRNKAAAGQWFDEHDVRKAAYRSLFAGAFGHTYGCHDVWMMYDKGKNKNLADARTGWRDAIKLPGAGQMQHARRLIEARPFLTRVPDQTLIVGDAGTGPDHAQATRDSDGTYALVYFPRRREVTIDVTKVKGPVRLSWFDPRTGKATPAGESAGDKPQPFTPPAVEAGAVGDDWVLIIDSAGKNYPLP